jgi:hypothetical protein
LLQPSYNLPHQDNEWRSPTEKGDKVSFRVSDVFLPDAAEMQAAWADTAEIDGTIVDFSDSGDASRVFAVVEIVQKQSVVVPVAKLRSRNN